MHFSFVCSYFCVGVNFLKFCVWGRVERDMCKMGMFSVRSAEFKIPVSESSG